MKTLHIFVTKRREPQPKKLWGVYREDGELLGVRVTRKAARRMSQSAEWRTENWVKRPRIVRCMLVPESQ